MIGPLTTLQLKRVNRVSDGGGGMTETWTDVIDIDGVLTIFRTSLRQNNEVLVANKITAIARHIFYCDVPDEPISSADKFVLEDREFNILFIGNPGNMNDHLEIILHEIV